MAVTGSQAGGMPTPLAGSGQASTDATATDPTRRRRPTADETRYQLARMVIIGGFLAVFLLVATMLVMSHTESSEKSLETADKAFNVLLPVLAGWVGTVLAFFFSAQGAERTSAILDNQLNRAAAATPGGGPHEDRLASTAMIQTESIRKKVNIEDPANRPEALTLGDLARLFGETKDSVAGVAAGPPVTRLMFVTGNVFSFVMHESVLNAYWRKVTQATGNPETTTLRAMLDDTLASDGERKLGERLSRDVVVISASATLGATKAALDGNPGAQDVIVTANGRRDEPLLGWLTNVDLLKTLKGS